MLAGIDCGSTLTKAAVRLDSGDLHFLSSKFCGKERFIADLVEFGVTEALVTGINTVEFPFQSIRLEGNKIQNEIETQVVGTKELLKLCGNPQKGFGLISIGTGVSYTFVYDSIINHLPIGGFIGGGFAWAVIQELNATECFDSDGDLGEDECKSSHLLVRDVDPSCTGSAIGELIVAACVNINKFPSAYSILDCVAASIFRDVFIFQTAQFWNPNKIVCIGSLVDASITFRKLLVKYGKQLGLEVIFPDYADMAGAYGALLRLEKGM